MHFCVSPTNFDGNIAGGTSGFVNAAQREIGDIGRQTVGGEVAVSTVEHHRDADAGAHG